MMGPYVTYNKGILELITESGPIVNQSGIPEEKRELLESQYSSPSAGSTCASAVTIKCTDTGKVDDSEFDRKIYQTRDGSRQFTIWKFRGSPQSFDRIEIVQFK
jgi:hypothetical protein